MSPSILTVNNTLGQIPGGGIPMQPPAVTAPVATIDDQTAAETDGSVTLTVTMSPAPTSAVSVDFTTRDGSANDIQDYVANTGTLNFGIGVTTQPVVITITDDPDVEGSENFFVDLSNPVGCTIADGEGEVTITSGDVASTADAVNLDGSTRLANSSPTVVADGTSFVSSIFVKPSSFGINARFFGSGLNRGVSIGIDASGSLNLFAYNTSNLTRVSQSGVAQLELNEWTHIAVALDLNNISASRIYVNGQNTNVSWNLLSSGAFNFSSIIEFIVGATTSGGTFSFNGDLAEVYYAPNEFVDLDANIGDFVNPDGTPVSQAGNPGYVYHSGGPASFATNLGTAGQPTVTGTLGQGQLPVRHPVMLHNWTETNTDGAASSTGFFRRGLAFEIGDMPAGQIPTGTADGATIPVAMMETNTWSDGSIRKATIVGNAGTFAAGQTKTIEIGSEAGVQGTSGIDPFAYLNSQPALAVQVRNHTGSTDNVNVGDLDFSAQTAMATASRREIQADNEVCIRLYAWQKVAPDEHLTCLHYVDLWLDGGAVVGVEWTPVLSQHWWVDDPEGVAQTKQERNYDATILDGATTLEQFAGLNHAYYCEWAALRTDNDDQHARRLWVDKGAAMPRLSAQYSLDSKRRMMRAGVLPPIRQGRTYTKTFTQTSHVPLGEKQGGGIGVSHNQREVINGTGGYEGRGIISTMDAIALGRQSASDWRIARVSAQAGLSAFFHIRDHRTATGGTANGDVSAGLIPPLATQLGPQAYPGLAGEVSAVTAPNGPGFAGTLVEVQADDAASAPDRPTGSFRNHDRAHHVDYSFFMAFIEGEAYLRDACLSGFDAAAIRFGNYNNIDFDPQPEFYLSADGRTVRRDAFNIPNVRYGSTWRALQERDLGWVMNNANHIYTLLPDGDRHQAVVERQIENHSAWIEASFGPGNSLFPASHLAKGGWKNRQLSQGSAFMNNFTPPPYYQGAAYAEDKGWTGIKKMADQTALLTANQWGDGATPYASVIFRDMRCRDRDYMDYTAPDDRFYIVDNVTSSGSILTMDLAGIVNLPIADDDKVAFTQVGIGGLPGGDVEANIPPEVSAGTTYFMVNVSGNTFQVASTVGGSPITLSNSSGISIGVDIAAWGLTPAGAAGSQIPPGDSSSPIAYAAIEMAYGNGASGITAAGIGAIRTWMQPVSLVDHPPWDLDGDMLL